MKKYVLLSCLVIASFLSGYAFKAIFSTDHMSDGSRKGRVTGIGGIFFKCKDPQRLKEWYSLNLGLNTNQYGSVFEWRQGMDSTQKGFTQWSPFKEKTKYFEPSVKEFMINYRVENLEALLVDLKKNGVLITDSIQTYDYGKFIHIMDPEANKIELWEPNDVVYEAMGNKMGLKTTK